MSASPVVAVSGLAAEARIAAGPGIVALAGGGDAARLEGLIEAALAPGAQLVLSFGIAGGLHPDLPPGTVLIARRVHAAGGSFEAAPAASARLAALLPGARLADLAGVDAPVVRAADKAALRALTGADAVDMESHVAARAAARAGLPFAALRVVADPGGRTLPPAALVGMRADGTTHLGAVLLSLARGPGQLPALVRTGLDARAAFAALRASGGALGALLDPGLAGVGRRRSSPAPL